MTMTRERLEGIIKAALSEMDQIAREHPYLSRAIEPNKVILREGMADARNHMLDDTALRIMAEKMAFVARNLALPLSVESAMEDSAKARAHWAEGKRDVHDGVFASVQTSLESGAASILGTPLPEPAVKYQRPTFVTLTKAQLDALEAKEAANG